jgi:hypothetical protein
MAYLHLVELGLGSRNRKFALAENLLRVLQAALRDVPLRPRNPECRVLGFRVWDLEFRVAGLDLIALGFRV